MILLRKGRGCQKWGPKGLKEKGELERREAPRLEKEQMVIVRNKQMGKEGSGGWGGKKKVGGKRKRRGAANK